MFKTPQQLQVTPTQQTTILSQQYRSEYEKDNATQTNAIIKSSGHKYPILSLILAPTNEITADNTVIKTNIVVYKLIFAIVIFVILYLNQHHQMFHY